MGGIEKHGGGGIQCGDEYGIVDEMAVHLRYGFVPNGGSDCGCAREIGWRARAGGPEVVAFGVDRLDTGRTVGGWLVAGPMFSFSASC